MAITYVGNKGTKTGQNSSSATTTISPNATIAVGAGVLLAVCFAFASAHTISTVSDDAGNTWQIDKQLQRSTSEVICVASCPQLTTQLLTSNIITITANSTHSAKYAITLEHFTGLQTGAADQSATGSSGSSTTSLAAGTTGAAAAGDLGVAFWACPVAQASVTADGSHTAFGVVSQAGCALVGEYNVSVSGAQSATATAQASTTYAGAQVTYLAVPSSGPHGFVPIVTRQAPIRSRL